MPTFQVCLDYALWIAIVSLALAQITWLQRISAWGPILIQGIGIFFLGQVIIQLGYLEIGHRMLPHDGLQESERRRHSIVVAVGSQTYLLVSDPEANVVSLINIRLHDRLSRMRRPPVLARRT